MSEDIKKILQRLDESRISDPNVSYEDMEDKVIARLSSYNSKSYTHLAKRIEQIKVMEAEMKKYKDEVKSMVRENIADLFNAEDAVKTRVVDTVSFIMSITKDPAPTESYKYAQIINDLSEQLTPELLKVLNDLKTKYKTITQKEAALKVQPKESISESLNESLASYFKQFFAFITRWCSSYDAKLSALKQQVIN